MVVNANDKLHDIKYILKLISGKLLGWKHISFLLWKLILGKQSELCEVKVRNISFCGYCHFLINNNNKNYKAAYNLQSKGKEQFGLTFSIICNFSYCFGYYRDIVIWKLRVLVCFANQIFFSSIYSSKVNLKNIKRAGFQCIIMHSLQKSCIILKLYFENFKTPKPEYEN